MPDVEPSVEVSVLRSLGEKEVSRTTHGAAYEALVRSMKDGLFAPVKEERVFFSVYPDSIEEFTDWLPSYTGPFDEAEFSSMTRESIQAMKNFAESLRWKQGFRVRDVLSLVSARKIR